MLDKMIDPDEQIVWQGKPGRLQKRGTIRLVLDVTSSYGENRSTSMGAHLKHIEEPYDVYNLIKRMALDIETDTRYPNAYRPKQKPGYNTEYRGGQRHK